MDMGNIVGFAVVPDALGDTVLSGIHIGPERERWVGQFLDSRQSFVYLVQ